MEVENPALAVVMERYDMAVGKVSVPVLIPVPALQADGIELADEIVREFLPVSHRPALSLFRGWGQFDSYRRVGKTKGGKPRPRMSVRLPDRRFALIYIKR